MTNSRQPGANRHRRGLSTIYFLLALPTLIIFTWFGVEIGLAIRSAGHAKIAADAVALAAAARLDEDYSTFREDAILAASINRGPNGPIVVSISDDGTGDVLKGGWNPRTQTFTPSPGSRRAAQATITFGPGTPNGTPGLILPGIFEIFGYELVRSSVAVRIPRIQGPSLGIGDGGLRMAGSSLLDSAGYVDVSLQGAGEIDLRGDGMIVTPLLRSNGPVSDRIRDTVEGAVESRTAIHRDPYVDRPRPEPSTLIVSSSPLSTTTLAPGYHAAGMVVEDRRVVLGPGIHQFGGPGLDVRGGGAVVLDRALIQLMDDESTLRLRDASRIEGKALAQGTWSGFAILTSASPGRLSLGQDAVIDVDGDIYGPADTIALNDRARLSATAAIVGGLEIDQYSIAEFRGGLFQRDVQPNSARLVH